MDGWRERLGTEKYFLCEGYMETGVTQPPLRSGLWFTQLQLLTICLLCNFADGAQDWTKKSKPSIVRTSQIE